MHSLSDLPSTLTLTSTNQSPSPTSKAPNPQHEQITNIAEVALYSHNPFTKTELLSAMRVSPLDETKSYFHPTEQLLKALHSSHTPISNILPGFENTQIATSPQTSKKNALQLESIETKLEEYKNTCGEKPETARKVIQLIRDFCDTDYQNHLDLSNLMVSTLPDIFDEPIFTDHLVFLNISRNNLKELPPSINKLANLIDLDITYNELSTLPDIANLIKLEKLSLARNQIKKLPDNLFKSTSLKMLDLSHNRCLELPDDAFALENLLELNVSYSPLPKIPNWVFNCKNLQTLDLSNTQLFKLENFINNLKKLKDLNLIGNFLKELPEEICELDELKYLHLDHNLLTKLPENIGNLKKLNFLSLSSSYNNHRNTIKTLPKSFTQLHHLKVLNLENNEITELPDDFGNLKHLITLNLNSSDCLGYNKISVLPDSFCDLTNLQILGLHSNSLTDLPKKFGQLKKLQELYIGTSTHFFKSELGNRFRKLPVCLLELEALKFLDLQGSSLFETTKELSSLRRMVFINNNYPGTTKEKRIALESIETILQEYIDKCFDPRINRGMVIKRIRDFCYDEEQKSLDLSGMNLKVLPDIFNDPVFANRLEFLNVSKNKLVELPPSINNLVNLKLLDISENEFTTFPDISGLVKLENLSLAKTKLDKFPENLLKITTLRILDLSHNQFIDLPDDGTVLENLVVLNFSFNNLQKIPSWVFNCTKLQSLNLTNTQLSKLEQSIKNLKNLKALNLSDNFLKELPEEICELDKLEDLNLDCNLLKKLPENIGKLKELIVLNLNSRDCFSFNKISILPDSFCELTKLEYLGLRSNSLTELPDNFGQLKKLRRLFIGNNGLNSYYFHRQKIGNHFTKFPVCLLELEALEMLNMKNSLFFPIDTDECRTLASTVAKNYKSISPE